MNASNRSRPTWLLAIILFGALCLTLFLQNRAAATFVTRAAADAGNSPEVIDGPSGSFASDFSIGTNDFGSWGAFAEATAMFGAIQLKAGGSGQGVSNVAAAADGSFSDELTISSPLLNGQTGNFSAIVTIDGNLVAASLGSSDLGTASAGVSAQLQAFSSLAFYSVSTFALKSSDSQGSVVESGDGLPFSVGLSFPFVFGEPFRVHFSLSATADGSGSGEHSSGGIGSVHATANWNGVSEVFAGPLGSITDFELTSSSGTDYTRTIPEPTTFVLFVLATAALLLPRSRSRGRFRRSN